jgi:hypothetical protein
MAAESLQIFGEEGLLQTLQGEVTPRPVAQGSKQAHDALVLLTPEGRWARLHLDGDNPFEASGLQAWLGQRVTVQGRWQGPVLVVRPENIEPLQVESGEEFGS